jgi:hypothetical protein
MSLKKTLLYFLYFIIKHPKRAIFIALGIVFFTLFFAFFTAFITPFFIDGKSVSCLDGAKKIEGTYRVDVIKAPFRVAPDDNSAKVINEKASDAVKKNVYIDVAFGYELLGACQKNGWIYGKIMRINGISASNSEYGWVQKKYVSLITEADAKAAAEEALEKDEIKPYPLLSSKIKCRTIVAETLNLATPPAINAMTRQDNSDGSRLFFVTVEHGNAPAERVKCLVSATGEAAIEQ